MPHLVKYTKTNGQTGDYEVEDLHDAVAYVERLRNEEGVDSARIFRIEEVRFEFRPYFRVEIGEGAPAAAAAAAPVRPSFMPVNEVPATPIWAPPAETAAPADDVESPAVESPAVDEPAPVAAAMTEADEPRPLADPWADAPPPPAATGEAEPAVPNGRRGLFGR